MAGPSVPCTMAMPWLIALSFMPKFSGKDCQIKFGPWLEQMESMLRAFMDHKGLTLFYGLQMGSQKGKLCCWMSVNGHQMKPFWQSQRLYGQPSSLAQIRVQFQCGQKESESEFYVLRFRELFNRWRGNEPKGAAQSEATARDQFVMGLRAGQVQRLLPIHSSKPLVMAPSKYCQNYSFLLQCILININTKTTLGHTNDLERQWNHVIPTLGGLQHLHPISTVYSTQCLYWDTDTTKLNTDTILMRMIITHAILFSCC